MDCSTGRKSFFSVVQNVSCFFFFFFCYCFLCCLLVFYPVQNMVSTCDILISMFLLNILLIFTAQLVPFKGANKILHVPAVVAVSCCLNHYQCLVDIVDLWIQNRISFLFVQVESPFPPSDKIGITSVQREVEEIIPMKTMKMNWLPYIPVDKRYFISSTCI